MQKSKLQVNLLALHILFSFMLITSIVSCGNNEDPDTKEEPIEEEDPCMNNSLESYIMINDEKHIIDLNNPELIVRCELDSSSGFYVLTIDELIQTVGEIEINDVFGVAFSLPELREGNYKLVRPEESFCASGEFALMPDQAFSSIQTSNCCEFYNEEATIQIFECDNRMYIKADSIVYREFECNMEQGGSFVAGFQVECREN